MNKNTIMYKKKHMLKNKRQKPLKFFKKKTNG
jgi:hypothetical protein